MCVHTHRISNVSRVDECKSILRSVKEVNLEGATHGFTYFDPKYLNIIKYIVNL